MPGVGIVLYWTVLAADLYDESYDNNRSKSNLSYSNFSIAFHSKMFKNEYFYKQVTVRLCEIRFDYS